MSASKPSHPRAHLVQPDVAWEDKATNFQRVRSLLASANVGRGDLIVLPEMFDTGFSCNLGATADTDGRTLAFLRSLSADLGAVVHGHRTVLGPDGRGRNRASVVRPDGSMLCEYDKMHLFPLGQSKESEHFAPGDGPATYTWMRDPGVPVASVCPTICYDLRFPELYRRALALGAEVMVVASSWPDTREEHRRVLSIARAIENQAFVLSVNRCGRDPSLSYAGRTLAVSARGEVLGALGSDPGVLSVEIDVRDLRAWRGVFPAWRSAPGVNAPSDR